MLGNIDAIRLTQTKEEFDKLKLSKLAFVAHKHIEDRFSIHNLYVHFEDELRELREITDKTVLPNKAFLEELADISNLIDIMYDTITNSYIYHSDKRLFGRGSGQ